eukprot:gb/GFBE01018311.1/.p1 GENE.gb/GFBE01018311.1/~~gb/GFBE01018311.1/.p1  ORF type:complete len:301 (+),score=67.60 gb/GFBE01018311.1/:1-903(+)
MFICCATDTGGFKSIDAADVDAESLADVASDARYGALEQQVSAEREAREAAEKLIEQEKKAREMAEQQAAEERVAREAAEKRIEEERKARQAAEEAAATKTATSPAPAAAPVPVPVPSAAPAPAPADEESSSSEYVIELQKSSSDVFGLQFDMTDSKVPVVTDVAGASLIEGWNSSCPSGKRVEVGHGLIKVNGLTDEGKAMVTKIKGYGGFALTFKKPTERAISLSKGGESIGLSMVQTGSATTGLLVHSASGKSADAGLKVCDHIVAVNGKEGCHPKELWEAISSSEELSLKVLSYST